MESTRSLEKILSKVKKLSSVTDILFMTKTGMFVLGSMRRSSSLEKFVGMAAILMGSAEAASLEMKDSIKGVVLQTKSSKIAITNVSENILLTVTFMGKEKNGKALKELEKIIAGQ